MKQFPAGAYETGCGTPCWCTGYLHRDACHTDECKLMRVDHGYTATDDGLWKNFEPEYPMTKPDPALWPEKDWPRCATCGMIRGAANRLLTDAFYSVAIETPELGKILCRCER